MLILGPDDPARNRPDVVKLPCGHCTGCRLDQSRRWADRCLLELQYHDSAYFVTLTYNDAHVPRTYYSDPATGEAFEALTLHKRDFQLFMKRLRKRFDPQKIRFFAAGEYGENTSRPHYHAILFGLKLDDCVPYQKSPQGFWYYKSESLQRVWSAPPPKDCVTPLTDPLGEVIVADVSWNTCAYTARYCMKKLHAGADMDYKAFSLEPPFSLMSRRPGIGRRYYDEHPEVFDYQYINLAAEDGGRRIMVPRYFDRLLERDNPERLEQIKTTRQEIAKTTREIKLSSTTLRDYEYSEVEEHKKQGPIRSLARKV